MNKDLNLDHGAGQSLSKPVQDGASEFKTQHTMTISYDTTCLLRCREMVEEKLGWPPAEQWRSFEFTELSEKIFEATEVQLSTTTLKRIFGKVRYESLPSSTTLNALARYLGFENWMELKAGVYQKEPATSKHETTPTRKETSRFSRKTILAAASVIVIIVISGFVILSGSSAKTNAAKDIVFKSRPLALGLPNSVVFNVDLKNTSTDDIIIQQYWDSTKTVRLQKGQTEATAIYYLPGYFRAKLIVDKKVIKEHDLFIRADEWMATIDHDPIPTYLKKEELVLNDGMDIAPAVKDIVKSIGKPTTLTYHLVRPFKDLQSDHFKLETSFKNTFAEGPAVCKTAKLFILCTNGAFIIPFTIPGCVSDINLKLGDKTWPGKSNDLSMFGIDPAKGIKLVLETKDRSVKIWANGVLIKEAAYDNDAGDIVGLRYSFLGSGSVDHVRLLNAKGNEAYRHDFR